MERTFILLKPDAVLRGLIGVILAEFEQKGLKLISIKMMRLSDTQLYLMYPDLLSKPFHDQVKFFMQIAPCVCVVLEGYKALTQAVRIAGPALKSEDNDPFTIRGRFALWTGADVIHRATTLDEAAAQIGAIFSVDELCDYERLDGFLMSEDAWSRRGFPV